MSNSNNSKQTAGDALQRQQLRRGSISLFCCKEKKTPAAATAAAPSAVPCNNKKKKAFAPSHESRHFHSRSISWNDKKY
jgi:hypothetical protein